MQQSDHLDLSDDECDAKLAETIRYMKETQRHLSSLHRRSSSQDYDRFGSHSRPYRTSSHGNLNQRRFREEPNSSSDDPYNDHYYEEPTESPRHTDSRKEWAQPTGHWRRPAQYDHHAPMQIPSYHRQDTRPTYPDEAYVGHEDHEYDADPDDDYDDEIDDESLNSNERLAQENAAKNEVLTRIYNPTSTPLTLPTPSDQAEAGSSPTNYSSSIATPPMAPLTPTNKMRKWLTGLLRRFSTNSATTPSRAQSASTTSAGSANSAGRKTAVGSIIRTIPAEFSSGKVLGPQQQNQICRALYDQPPPPPGQAMPVDEAAIPDELLQITSQSFIWVFRAYPTSDKGVDVWSNFDLKNQQILSKQAEWLDNISMHPEWHQHPSCRDDGVEIYDSHIQGGQFPVLVVLSRKECFYPEDEQGSAIHRLEINCIPNTPATQFVNQQRLP